VFGGIFRSCIGPVGIDYGLDGVKMLQVREHGATLEVIGAARIDTPLAPALAPIADRSPGKTKTPPNGVPEGVAGPTSKEVERLGEQIHAAYMAGNFTGRKCVVSLARADVQIQSLRLPKMPDDELRQTAIWEASQRFKLDRQAIQVDFIRTGATLQGGENKDEVILIVATHEAIHLRLEPILAAGLRPVAVDTGFGSLARLFSRRARRDADRDRVRAVVEIGRSGSMVLILRGDEIAFCKPFNHISGKDFNRAVAEHLQMDEKAAAELRAARIGAAAVDDQGSAVAADSSTDRAVFEAVRPLMGELVKEVIVCLRYYGVTFRGHPPERIILTGGDGLEPRLGETMAKACKVPVDYDDATPILDGLGDQIRSTLNRTPGPTACWAVALGVGLRGLQAKQTRDEGLAAHVKEAA
jgi:type IV pilus assembly protein PilM